MLVVALAAALSATPSIAVTPFETAGLDPLVVAAWTERFAVLLAEGKRVKVVTQQDVQQLLGLERQRALLGCSENSCMTEIVAALGAEGLVRGTVTRSGSTLTLTVKVLKTRDGSTWASATERVTNEDAAQAWLDRTAREISETLVPPEPVTWPRWVPAIAGGVLAGGAVACLVMSLDLRQQLTTSSTLDANAIQRLAAQGRTVDVLGGVFAGAALAAIAASIIWVAASPAPPSAVKVVWSPMHGGAWVGVGGAW